MESSFLLRPSPNQPAVVAHATTELGARDVMREGLVHARAQTFQTHPLETSERNWVQQQDRLRLKMLESVQGTHGPMRLHMERSTVAAIQRPGGLASSNIAFDALTARDELVDFDDYLGVIDMPQERPDFHTAMEAKLGM